MKIVLSEKNGWVKAYSAVILVAGLMSSIFIKRSNVAVVKLLIRSTYTNSNSQAKFIAKT